ncbi:uncharacterized protein J8A68_001933 [[Candida] subhashii]|uniref:Nucleoporin POM33 n=1 Tax=[Candida] subhashii TaxID=561895 RepID=A0A8J5UQ70_9ASCO|nr:uncharacterized protein J8A68_001933 [[Candida] subhashii]KAG7664546.1 hypothetical protein J8A68_001933 [[Candida] subhashii]
MSSTSVNAPDTSTTTNVKPTVVSTDKSTDKEEHPIINQHHEEPATQQKKRKLIRTSRETDPLKFKIWLGGHIATIVFGSISLLFQLLWIPNKYYINSISYRLTFVGAIVALTATFSHKFGLSYLPKPATLLSQQNFQYIVLALVWVFTFKSTFKILPYYFLAILHIGNIKNISAITNESEFLASLIAYDELLLIGYLFLRTIFFRNGAGYQLLLFLVFYWVRVLYNKETRNLFAAIIQRLDYEMVKVQNEKVKHYWGKTKEFIEVKQSEADL